MSLAGACTNVSGWVVTGITTNFGIDEIPRTAIPTAALPALYLAPEWPGRGRGGYTALDIGLNAGRAVFSPRHVLLYKAVGMGTGPEIFGGLIALIDNYLSIVADNWLLNDNLLEPLTITGVELGRQEAAGMSYYGAAFYHQWVLRLT